MAATLIAGGLVALPGSAEARLIEKINMGGWQGGAYTDDDSGKFSHCAASARYKSGLLLLFSVTRERKWSLGISSDDWNLKTGSRHPVQYQVDKGPVLDGTAIAKSKKVAQVFLPANDRLFGRFMRGNLLKLKAAKQLMQFRLTNTKSMLRKLLRCAIAHAKRENGGSDPFSSNSNTSSDPFSSSNSNSSDPFSSNNNTSSDPFAPSNN